MACPRGVLLALAACASGAWLGLPRSFAQGGGAAPSVPADTPLLQFERRAGANAEIALLGVPEGIPPISPLVAGKFTEHLGRNVYLGAWAQMLLNPVFAPDALFGKPAEVERLRKTLAGRLGPVKSGSPLLDPHVAPGWMPVGHGGAYQFVAKPSESAPCRQTVELADRGEAGLMTIAHFPFERTQIYRLRLAIAAPKGSPAVQVGVYAPSLGGCDFQQPLSNVESLQPGAKIAIHELPLTIDRARFPKNRMAVLAIRGKGAGALALERAELFPDDALDGWDPEVVALYKQSGIRVLRFPGGNFVSGYHWKDGVGPRDQRPVRKNPAWGGVEFNAVGTDEWIRFCELIGARPMICVNAGNGAAEEAADWVEYCNGSTETKWGSVRDRNGHAAPYGVKLWEVGNELYGGWQIGHVTADQYAPRYDAFARAMWARDPSIRLLANGNTVEWDRTVARDAREPLQTFTLHRLTSKDVMNAEPRDAFSAIASHPVWFEETQLPQFRDVLQGQCDDPRLALTELQIMGGGPGQPSNRTLGAAIFYAGMMNAAIRSRGYLDILTHSALINHGGGMHKIDGVVFTDPVYDAFRFYADLVEGRPMAIRIAGPEAPVKPVKGIQTPQEAPLVDAAAALAPDGKRLDVVLMNRSVDREIQARVVLGLWGATAAKAQWRLLAAENFADGNSLEEPHKVRVEESERPVRGGALELTLPTHSLGSARVSWE
ncbi:MAG: hypothetical protein NTW86_28605 [Candidatus Sumerlaeota bacterium]|nr:hypothetical protein [Candidatus Sumerlaeota bacterium]